MHVALRRLSAMAIGGAAALTFAVQASAATTTGISTRPVSSPKVTTTDSCDRDVSPGYVACFAVRRTDTGYRTRFTQQNSVVAPYGYGPSTLQSAYALPSSTAGSGQRVYIVDAYDNPNAESDLAAYRSQYGLPACTTANGCFQKLNQNGATSPLPEANSGWAGEESLDVDMVSAVCPNCGITLIESDDNGIAIFAAVKEAAALGAKFVSMSFGGSESSSNSYLDSHYFQPSGVVYTASTGDAAYQEGAEYPATSAYTVAVGGTSLTAASNARGYTETVWKTNNTEGTGSGCSSYTAKPSWQASISDSVCGTRAEADVSAVADPATGVAVYQTYGGNGWTVYGGTSAAAPIVAATYALAGAPSSTTSPASLPYAHSNQLNDVTSGDNGTCSPSLLCTAATGWDGPTGLGTPHGIGAFGESTVTAPNTVTVTDPGSQTGAVGTAKNVQITAADSAGAALSYVATGLPDGLSIDASTGVISGTPTSAGSFSSTVTATDTSGASGSATFSWTISATTSTVCSGQKLTNPGFESGSTGWNATHGAIRKDTRYARAGKGFAYLDGYGHTHTDTLSRTVTIPAGCGASLTYYLRIASRERTSRVHDTIKLTVSGAAAQSFSNADQRSGYVLRRVDLSKYAGSSVVLKWTGTENSSASTAFLIDDVALNLG